jgi:hypothetical protein
LRAIPRGLTIDDHRALGDRLRGVREALLAVRAMVADGEGSGSNEYSACSKLLRELKTLETVLRLAAVGAHVDKRPLGALQRLYGDHNNHQEEG